MSMKINERIKKYAGSLWLGSVALTFAFAYIICSLIANVSGLDTASVNAFSVSISAVVGAVMYIVLAIWALRTLE